MLALPVVYITERTADQLTKLHTYFVVHLSPEALVNINLQNCSPQKYFSHLLVLQVRILHHSPGSLPWCEDLDKVVFPMPMTSPCVQPAGIM